MNWETLFYGCYVCVFNHCDIIRLQSHYICVFEPHSGAQRAKYNDHLKLIGKRKVDFLLVLIELLLLYITRKTLQANIGSKLAIPLQWGPVYAKFQVEGVAPTNDFFVRKLG